MRQILIPLVATLCLVSALPTEARKLYKWTDADNVEHYTGLPPEGAEVEILRVPDYKPTPPDAPEQAPSSAKPTAATTPKATGSGENATAPPLDPEQKKRNCEIASTNLKALETYPRIYVTDEQTGEKRYLTPDEHVVRTQSTREEIKKYCE